MRASPRRMLVCAQRRGNFELPLMEGGVPQPASALKEQWHTIGPFWLWGSGHDLRILTPAGSQLQVTGALSAAISRRDVTDPVLVSAARQQPDLAALLEALSDAAPVALTRAALMRGTGFDTLFVELTARCNERCVHCYAEASPERTETLPWEILEGIIEDCARLGFARIQFTGGDPLIAAYLLSAVRKSHALAIPQIEIYTNGLALTDSLLAALAPYSPTFAFSVYSADADAHDAITRVSGSHVRTLRAIGSCRALGLTVRVGATLLAHTVSGREELRRMLEELGVSPANIGFVMSHAVGRGDFVVGENDAGQHGGSGAALGSGKACVTADGDVVPCIFARDRVLGNVHQDRLQSLLTAAAPIRSSSFELDSELERAATRLSCADCRLREVLLAQSVVPPRLITLRSHA